MTCDICGKQKEVYKVAGVIIPGVRYVCMECAVKQGWTNREMWGRKLTCTHCGVEEIIITTLLQTSFECDKCKDVEVVCPHCQKHLKTVKKVNYKSMYDYICDECQAGFDKRESEEEAYKKEREEEYGGLIGTYMVTICERCGKETDCLFEADPFNEDVNEDDTPVWECDDCREASALEI
jgi:DNA-directed RNA polymerase subunit RPC12/RpoP